MKNKLKTFFKWLWSQLKDKTNLIIFAIVNLIVSSGVWIPYLLAILTNNKWLWAVGSAVWAFWLAPFTPFTAITIGATFAIRKIYDAIKNKNDKIKPKNDKIKPKNDKINLKKVKNNVIKTEEHNI